MQTIIGYIVLAFFGTETDCYLTPVKVPAHDVWHTEHPVFGIDTVLVRFPEGVYQHSQEGTLMGYEVLESLKTTGYLPYQAHRYRPPFTQETLPVWAKQKKQIR